MGDMRSAKVGDLIVVETRGRHRAPSVDTMEVVKVGREYLYAANPAYRHLPIKFRRDNGNEHTGYSPDRTAFLTHEALDEYRRLAERRSHASRLKNSYIVRFERLSETELETLIALLEKACA